MDTTAPITPIDTELEELQHLALAEGCNNPQDAIRSRTAKVVLGRVSNQVFHATNGEESFSPMIASIYDKFLSKTPITGKEHILLLSNFQFSTNQQRAKDIVSKLNFAYGRENQKFFDEYMKNDDEEINPMNLINYITREILEYKLVLDENEDNIQELGKVAGVGTYYTYEEAGDGAEKGKKLILVSDNGVMSRYEHIFKTIKLLGDGLLFGVTQEKDEYSENKLIGNILENKGGVLINIYPESGMIDARLEMNGMIITTWKDGKKGLLKEITREEENRFVVEGVKEKQGPRKIVELMPMIYDKLYFQGKEGFIFTSSQIHDKPFNQVHIYNCLEDEAHGPLSLSLVKTLHGSTGGDIQLRDHGYFTITKKDGIDLLRYDPVKKELLEVEGLQGIINDKEEIEKLLQGEIAYLQYAGKGGLYTLEHETGKVNRLATVELGEGTRLLSPIVMNDKISLHYLKDGKKYKMKNLWLQNGKLYESAGFIGVLKLMINMFSSSSSDENVDPSSFQSVQSALKEVVGPIRL